VFVLPLIEAPKNIAWLVMTLAGAMAVYGQRATQGPWGAWDTLFLVWMGSGFAIAPLAGLPREEWSQALDLVRMGTVAWLLLRLNWPREWLIKLLWAALAGTVLATAHGLWLFEVVRTKEYLELKSVGHVNHSAIYLVTIWAVAVALAFTAKLRGQLLLLTLVVFFTVAVVLSQSRAALGVMLATGLVMALFNWPRARWPVIAVAVGSTAIAASMLVLDTDMVRKHVRNVKHDNVMAYRPLIWARATEAFYAHPAAGIGMGSFAEISDERLRAWVEKRGIVFDANRYLGTSHAHSLYFNTLAERGALGSLAVVALLAAWGVALLRSRQRMLADSADWALWLCALAAWLVVIGIGLTNTTLHHEHGSLALLLLGAMLARDAALKSAIARENAVA
jgi:O-antigen ligase